MTGQSMFLPPKMSIFPSKLLLDNSPSFTSSRMKIMCRKWNVKLNIRCSYGLPGAGIVENRSGGESPMEVDLTDTDHIFYARSTPLEGACRCLQFCRYILCDMNIICIKIQDVRMLCMYYDTGKCIHKTLLFLRSPTTREEIISSIIIVFHRLNCSTLIFDFVSCTVYMYVLLY